MNTAQDIPAVQAALDAARALNDSRNYSLEEAKANAIAEIKALPHLTDAEKQAAIDAVNAATTIPTVQAELDKARALNDQRAAELAQAKADAKAVIDSLPNLTAEEKAAAKDAIDKAADKPAIDAIVDAARTLNDSRNDSLAKAKEAAIAAINALPNLTDAEKQAAIDAVNSATTPEAVQAELDKARALNDQRAEDLLKAKTAAKEAIDALPNQTAEEKAAFKAAVDAATTIPAVQAVVDEARSLNDSRNGDKTLDAAKAAAKEVIQGLGNLSVADKAALLDRLAVAADLAAVSALVEEARRLDAQAAAAQAAAQALADAKKTAIDAINQLPHLSAAEKQAYINAIQSAQNVDAVLAVLETARANAATAQVKAAKVQASSSLPATGQADSSAILSLAIAMILASLAVLGLPRKEDNR